MKIPTQFHENAAVIAWWRARFGAALRWQVPARRRATLAIGACVAGVVIPVSILTETRALAWRSEAPAVVAVIAILFAFLWLAYRAAAQFALLPAPVRRHPQLALHLLYWATLIALWNTAAGAGPWRAVLLGVAVVLPFLLWRCGYLLLAGQLPGVFASQQGAGSATLAVAAGNALGGFRHGVIAV